MIPNALTIAGSDCSGGAGIQADLKAFSALGAYGASVITALTAQNTRGVRAIHEVPADFVRAQLDAVFEDLRIDAVKIGMLSSPAIIEVVADAIERFRPGVVVLDPVMVAKSGDSLLRDDAVEVLASRLVPLATLLTPNLPEACTLLGRAVPIGRADMDEVAAKLRELGPDAVLLKGGHLEGESLVDLLDDGDEAPLRLASRRFDTHNTHGTGCSLSSGVAARLGAGESLRDAVILAHSWLQGAIASSEDLDVGEGHGPVHHFHALWE